jgi:hypothetical protein
MASNLFVDSMVHPPPAGVVVKAIPQHLSLLSPPTDTEHTPLVGIHLEQKGFAP